MKICTLIKKSEYHDSVSLMLVARELAKIPGVQDAAVVMATEANKGILQEAGLITSEAEAASANDLVIAVRGEEEVLAGALSKAEQLLQVKSETSIAPASQVGYARPRSIASAIRANTHANLAVISVAGRYAVAEAWDALQHGLHVLLFSDNVSIEDEIALKQYAVAHHLLMMGPGAGTAILNGVALGFANVLPRGPVGIVSAAGTGLQEVSSLLARQGIGISQAIGTGGRDLKEPVGGMMMLAGLQALQEDADTKIIVLISKPPEASIVDKVVRQVRNSQKPTVICFLGAPIAEHDNINVAYNLEQAAFLSAQHLLPGANLQPFTQPRQLPSYHFQPEQHYLRALFSGGTLCYEAQVIWRELLHEPIFSNAPLNKIHKLPDAMRSLGHTAIDLGEEEFTVGRPHPMLDNDLRIRRMLQEARDPETAVILFDVVLGYGAHPDPASELAPAIAQARALAVQEKREIAFIASVTGTEEDPQCRSRQVKTLEETGVIVCESNAQAARLAAKLINEIKNIKTAKIPKTTKISKKTSRPPRS